MAVLADDVDFSAVPGADTAPDGQSAENQLPATEAELALAKKIAKTIRADKEHHKSAFERMKRDMRVAMHGCDKGWGEDKYRANFTGRHVKQKTAQLYAKNPKASAVRRETLDFVLWDESEQSLTQAMQIVQAQQQAEQQAALAVAAGIGHNGGPPMMTAAPPLVPQMPGYAEAAALIQDVQQGMARRRVIKRIGKTLEILFAQAIREQKPLDFKMAMKQLVRRTCTTSVGYVEIGFQRETGPRPGMTEKLADARGRLDHLRALAEDVANDEVGADDAEVAELQASIAALQAEPEIVIREGLIFDYPQSTKVIPDKLCKSLVGFIGARHITIEYLFTKDEVKEMFGVDLGKSFTPYREDGGTEDRSDSDDGLVCVWKFYDKPSGLVYYLCDGNDGFLRPAAAPDVFVEEFWPVFALTFNAVESEDELFPPSDVGLLLDMQKELNRSRQGKREHRQNARPRFVFPKAALDSADIDRLKEAEPFDVFEMNIEPGTDIKAVLQPVPIPGVDPNLYDTGEVFADAQLVVGAQEAQLGGLSKATATETAIAASSASSSDGSSVDDLDAFLTCIARASGQILLREMSEEKVKEIAGPGAVWPHLTLADIANELMLEVEAGSTGKPNKAIDVANMKELLPFLIQMPGMKPEWLLRQTLMRLDDRLDYTEAIVEGLPSIVAMNQNAQISTGDPATDPNAQAGAGDGNAPRGGPAGSSGSGPAFGSNQV